MAEQERMVTVIMEPSKRLSEMLGSLYYIERRYSVEELLEKGMIALGDIAELESGIPILKQFRMMVEET
ncbi:hypothetical protein LCGC14_3007540 [marine sediment metagenome]|uniref:Uncharacterized protein n=1 Tax=marine sediment metagenome TaxID=412755 RepID=A0A0F8WZ17_9ZZZZ